MKHKKSQIFSHQILNPEWIAEIPNERFLNVAYLNPAYSINFRRDY